MNSKPILYAILCSLECAAQHLEQRCYFHVVLTGYFRHFGYCVSLINRSSQYPCQNCITGIRLQIIFALLVLYVPAGKDALNAVTAGVSSVIDYGQQGISFLFGGLATGSVGFVFAINVLGIIIFFSALISALYHIGLMPKVINVIGGGLQRLLGTGRAESLSATANIFVGMVEAPLVVKPYLTKMSDSQFFAVMTCGLASVAGGTLVGYASLGVELNFLIAAAFMSAPAGLLMAKMMVPPSDKVNDQDEITSVELPRATNVVEALADGAMSGVRIAVAVGARYWPSSV